MGAAVDRQGLLGRLPATSGQSGHCVQENTALRAQIGGVVAGAPRVPAVELAVKLNVNREVGRAGESEVQGQRASHGEYYVRRAWPVLRRARILPSTQLSNVNSADLDWYDDTSVQRREPVGR